MTCNQCCIYSGRTNWHKGDYDRPVCPFYKSESEMRSYVEISESEWKARDDYKLRKAKEAEK